MAAVFIICAVSCIGMIVLALAQSKIKIGKFEFGIYWLMPFLGVLALLLFNFINAEKVFYELTSPGAINPIKVILVFLSIMVLSIYLDEAGFFKYLANVVLERFDSTQTKLFTAFYFVICFAMAFFTNDVIILTFTPFICYFTKNAKLNPVPYLVSCFVAANVSSMFFLIVNPTNIYLATAYGFDFWSYFKIMLLPTLFAIFVAYVFLYLLFRKPLSRQISRNCQRDTVTIKNKLRFVFGLLLFCVTILLISIASYIDVEIWIITMTAVSMLFVFELIYSAFKWELPKELGRTFRKLPWELVPFVMCMFVLVITLREYGIASWIGELLGTENSIWVYGIASVVFANIINNIPMCVLFVPVLQNADAPLTAVYATIIGSNIGALFTPIGALAGIMWLSIIKRHNIKFSFTRFIYYGFIVAIPTLIVALCGLMVSSLWL